MRDDIDILFAPFYVDRDRWHNDSEPRVPSIARTRAVLEALDAGAWMKDEVDIVIDGKLFDFSRFLSLARYGSSIEHERYDPFNITLLAGTYFLNFLHRAGFTVKVTNVVDRRILEELGDKYNPRFVMLSTTLLFDAVEKDTIPNAIAQIRAQWPDAIVVLGGLLLVSYRKNLAPETFTRLLLQYGADVYIASPNSEMPLLEVLSCRSAQELRSHPPIANTYVRHATHISSDPSLTEASVPIDDSFIRWSQLPRTDHLYHTVHMRTARSCAFSCAFCEYPVNQGPLTTMSLETIDKELSELRSLQSVKSIVFTDDTFNVPLGRFKQILGILKKYEFEWYSFFRPQYADRETAEMMKQSGCRAVFAGLESVDQTVLSNMNKKATPGAYRKGLAELKRQGISVHANFIVGFPGETAESVEKMARFIDETEPEFITVCTWVYIPSTPIGLRCREFQIEGFGMHWKHISMNSNEAGALARAVVSEQKRAVHNAVRGEAWSEFLLYANGCSTPEIQSAVSTFNSFIGRDVSMQAVKSSPKFRSLESWLQKHNLPRPIS